MKSALIQSKNTDSCRQKLRLYKECIAFAAAYSGRSSAQFREDPKNESELVVAVRPEIILPGTSGQLKLSEEISKVEGPRETNMLQVEPTMLDEAGESSRESTYFFPAISNECSISCRTQTGLSLQARANAANGTNPQLVARFCAGSRSESLHLRFLLLGVARMSLNASQGCQRRFVYGLRQSQVQHKRYIVHD